MTLSDSYKHDSEPNVISGGNAGACQNNYKQTRLHDQLYLWIVTFIPYMAKTFTGSTASLKSTLFKYMYLWTGFQGVLQMVEQRSTTGQNVCMSSCCSTFDYGGVHQGSLSRSAGVVIPPKCFIRVWKFCGYKLGDEMCTLIKSSN